MIRVLQQVQTEIQSSVMFLTFLCFLERTEISVRNIPVELSPGGSFSKGVFVYENPTPAGESRNSMFAAEIPSDS